VGVGKKIDSMGVRKIVGIDQWSVKRRIGLNTEGAESTETEAEPKYEELRGSLPPMFL
jgi:hypothetical protein